MDRGSGYIGILYFLCTFSVNLKPCKNKMSVYHHLSSSLAQNKSAPNQTSRYEYQFIGNTEDKRTC